MQRIEEHDAGVDWKAAVYLEGPRRNEGQPRLSIERMVKLARVSRSGFYRFLVVEPSRDRDLDLRDAIQRIVVEWPS